MSEKELYQQKMQATLDEWKADVDKLKARASSVSADAQLEMNKRIEALEHQIEEGRAKLSALADAAEDAWQPIKQGMDSAWVTLRASVADAVEKFKS